MSDYLFDNHFHLLVWKRNKWFGANNLPELMQGFIDLKFDQDKEFWEDTLFKEIKGL